MAAIAGLLAAGVLVDLPDRPVSERPARYVSALAAPARTVNTWFCPGGSGPDGAAELTVQLASGSDQRRTAAVSVLPDGSDPDDARTVDVEIEPRGRVLLRPSEEVPGAQWVGAVVEVDGAGVVVEQILTTRQGGVGRSPCLTRTAGSWVVPNGATRSAVEGERFIVMLLNPFPDIAVADIELVADVGRDSIEGLVVPARRVVAVDVTEEITVATTVAAFVDVVSGRVAASWIQISDGPIAGTGVRAAAAVPDAAPRWHLPVAGVGAARRDVVAVSNPSADRVAEVDLEIIAEAPGTDVSPIEITVRPDGLPSSISPDRVASKASGPSAWWCAPWTVRRWRRRSPASRSRLALTVSRPRRLPGRPRRSGRTRRPAAGWWPHRQSPPMTGPNPAATLQSW